VRAAYSGFSLADRGATTMNNAHARRPTVSSALMHEAFEVQARRLGLRPSDRWVGGYVDYEWDHVRHVVAALPRQVEGLKVLEFGCNVGATAILFAHLGARVTAIDVDAGWIELARFNARRYGKDAIAFDHVRDTRALPYADGQFDLVACNSVLEYVDGAQLAQVQREIDRVLAPGGLILLTGTSNRLWPRECHSGNWLGNYLPRALDQWCDAKWQRGMSPWRARHGFGAHYDNLDSADADGFFARARRAMGASEGRLAAVRLAARVLGTAPGLLTPYMSCLLQKRA
jgi:SAM-dependent methyltransferase